MKFATKIFIYIFLSTAFIIGGMSAITHHWITRYHKNEIIIHSRELAVLTAMKSEDYILRNERLELYKFFQSIVKTNSYISYLFVEQKGDVLVHTFDKGVPKGLLGLKSIEQQDNVNILPIRNNQGNIIYHLRVSIGSPIHSILHLGVSDQVIQAQLVQHRNILLMIGGILLLVVPFCLALFLSRFVSRPLTVLRKGVKRIGSGELDYRLELPTGDEIEQLVSDINTMAEKLEKLRHGLTEEIAERMQAENELAKQSDLLNNILLNVPHYVFWKDKTSVYLGCNKAFAQAAGLASAADIAGRTDFDLPWENRKAEFYRECDQTVINTKICINDVEDTLLRADGREESIIMNISPLKDQAGSIFGIMGLYYDITERKIMEDTVKQGQKMEAIGTLAGGIAHDFNNILGSIIGFTELAEDEAKPDSTIREYLQQVLTSAYRARDLVRQILTFSRKNKEERRPIRLSSVIKEELKLLGATLPTTIEIHQRIDDIEGRVNADPTQLHQIVMNLCTNAAQAMKEAGGRLDLTLSNVVVDEQDDRQTYHGINPGSFMKLSISDTGAGIAKKNIHRIFEPFFTTKTKEMGTGMGLAVVHGIVKELNGDILVKSDIGVGTKFTVMLPREINDSNNEKIQPSEIPTGQGRILFVDDEKPLLELGKKTLGSLGYHVTAVNGSLEALNTYQGSPDAFDLIITDHTMPHLTGYEMARQILKSNPCARILLCTGYSDTITPEKVELAGIRALLFKPIGRKKLASVIQEILNS